MADNRSRLEKFLGMLGSDQMGERAAAAQKIADMAKEQKITIAELCMGTARQADPPPRQPPPRDNRGDGYYRDPFRRDKGFSDDFFDELNRRAREQARRNAEAEAARKKAESKPNYHGRFDDAEMSDDEREAVRQRRETEARARRNRHGSRELLNELKETYALNDNDLAPWECEFAESVPYQYRFDYELSAKQERTARMIIAKILRNRGESPI